MSIKNIRIVLKYDIAKMHCIKYWSVALRKNRKDIINIKRY